MSPEQHARSIAKLLRGLACRHDLHQVFRDCMECSAIALATLDLRSAGAREARYLEIVKRYRPEELAVFPKVVVELVEALEGGPYDVMGAVFGELEIGNAARGQFFTPYPLAKLLASLQVGDGTHARDVISSRGFVRVHEPATGAGGLVIAMADALQDVGINYQQHMHVTAVDVDSRAVHMAFVQLALLHVPAVVYVGNSLSLQMIDAWCTPAHILGGWSRRLASGDPQDIASDEQEVFEPVDPPPFVQIRAAVERSTCQLDQLALF